MFISPEQIVLPLGLALASLMGSPSPTSTSETRAGSTPAVESTPAETVRKAVLSEMRLNPALGGRSGSLRVRIVLPGEQLPWPLEDLPEEPQVRYRWVATGGGAVTTETAWLASGAPLAAPQRPGQYRLELGTLEPTPLAQQLTLVVKVPYHQKRGAYLNGYHVGDYPPSAAGRGERYASPTGFLEVTPENQGLLISEHFRLGQFLTHDQRNVWPKYVVLSPDLIDKLELVLAELSASGVRAERMVVMSGFRTPQYNARGLGQGRAKLSRHQYGDAADVWVDNDGDWYMDDLNGDGRRDIADARVLLQAVDRVESRYPELTGGAGVYPDNGAHGPFLHVDTRGTRARW